MSADYRALVQDGASGSVLAEIPLTFDSPIQYKMCDVGQYSAHMPVDHPKAKHAILEDGLREITVLRNDTPVANGPYNWAVDSVSRMINFTVFEASAYFDEMIIESFVTHNEDRFNWVRDVWTLLTTKTSTAGDGTGSPGSSINAGWPNFTVSSGTSGYTLNSSIVASDFATFRDLLNKLAESPDQGIEWRVDISALTGSRGAARKLQLGAPLGTTSTRTLTEFNLASYGRSGDVLGSATRVHVRGNGITSTKQNTGAISGGWPLLEKVLDRSDISDQTQLDDAAREFRRQMQPPIKVRSAAYTPGPMLPFGAFNLGDTVPIAVNDPAEMLDINVSNLRVVGIDVTPPSGNSPELVSLTFDLPLSATGA